MIFLYQVVHKREGEEEDYSTATHPTRSSPRWATLNTRKYGKFRSNDPLPPSVLNKLEEIHKLYPIPRSIPSMIVKESENKELESRMTKAGRERIKKIVGKRLE